MDWGRGVKLKPNFFWLSLGWSNSKEINHFMPQKAYILVKLFEFFNLYSKTAFHKLPNLDLILTLLFCCSSFLGMNCKYWNLKNKVTYITKQFLLDIRNWDESLWGKKLLLKFLGFKFEFKIWNHFSLLIYL